MSLGLDEERIAQYFHPNLLHDPDKLPRIKLIVGKLPMSRALIATWDWVGCEERASSPVMSGVANPPQSKVDTNSQ